METQHLNQETDRISYGNVTYLVPHTFLASLSMSKPCEFRDRECEHIRLASKGIQTAPDMECAYKPTKDLEWEIAFYGVEGFQPQPERCETIDVTLMNYIEIGLFDEYIKK